MSKASCLLCFDIITDANAVEYKMHPYDTWHFALFCFQCITILQQTQFKKYCEDIVNSTCAKELRALLARGPPVNVFDKNGFPMSSGCEIYKFRHRHNGEEFSPKLKGSLEGQTRLEFWEQQKKFLAEDPAE